MHVENNKAVDIKNFNLNELEAFVAALGENRYRARQIMEWVYHHNVSSFEKMTSLPKEFRTKISIASYISNPNIKVFNRAYGEILMTKSDS